MKKLAIIHNLPIDYYPPAVNLINTIKGKANLYIFTTRGAIGNPILSLDGINVAYAFKERRNGSSTLNLLRQIWFIIFVIVKLIIINPDVILYYESISAAPVFLYKRFINRKVKVNAHYHEYMTRQEYRRPGMRVWELYRQLEEKWLWRHTEHISHTNSYRMDFFRKDYPFIQEDQCCILPNYPPGNWQVRNKEYSPDGIIRCVYVGSLSLKDMYLKEFIEWVNSNDGKITIDFYAFNFHPDIIEYFRSISSPWIRLHTEGVRYFDIPQVLAHFDIGILIYHADKLNVKYCETNKFYEYVSCGLKVIFPMEMSLLMLLSKQGKFKDILIPYNPRNSQWPNLTCLNKSNSLHVVAYGCEGIYNDYLNMLLA